VANNKPTIDISAIQAQIAKAKANAAAAQKAFQAVNSQNTGKSKQIASAQIYQKRAQNFDPILNDYSEQINELVNQLSTGISSPSLEKELTTLVSEYNSTAQSQISQYAAATNIIGGGSATTPAKGTKQPVVDVNGNVNGVAPTIVFDSNGQPVKNPDGSYKTAVGATAPDLDKGIVPFAPAKTVPVDQNGQLVKASGKKSTIPPKSNTPVDTNITQYPAMGTGVKTTGTGNAENANAVENRKSINKIASEYGAMGSYALTMPWMKNLLLEGAKAGWTPTKFSDMVKNYVDPTTGKKPWDQIASSIRDSSIAYYDNPQQWAAYYNKQLPILRASAIAQGEDPSVFGDLIDLNDSKSIDAAYQNKNSIMTTFMNHYYNNLPDSTILGQFVSNHTTFAKTDGNVYAGVLGQNADALKSYASDMGVAAQYLPPRTGGPNTGDYFANASKAIQDGTTTLEEQQNYIKQQAINMYAPYSARIAEGMSVRALASPYLNAAANLMETDPSTIDLGSMSGLGANITKAMQGDGKTSIPLDQYITQVKQDPAWLKTGNARNSLMDTATSLLQSFGMVN
jgi:uncharacterized FlaG/YvyC family protein